MFWVSVCVCVCLCLLLYSVTLVNPGASNFSPQMPTRRCPAIKLVYKPGCKCR